MAQVDFYVLSDAAPDAHLRQACRLAQQAVDEDRTVFVRANDVDARRIDDLLWTFGDRSFLPHEIVTDASPTHPRIRIVIGLEPPPGFGDVVINLSTDPAWVDHAVRIAEFVPTDPERKRLARERFKTYRERGIEPITHTL